ncbi:MAG: hypothetical protein ACFB4I_06450 [Cyanophyceae cyanobacterium]
MSKIKQRRQSIIRFCFAVLACSFLWLSGWGFAEAATSTDTVYIAQARTDRDTIKPKPADARVSEAIKECLPPGLAAADIGERVEQAIQKSSSNLAQAFDITDNPQLSDAEKQFESCLRTKGVLPKLS